MQTQYKTLNLVVISPDDDDDSVVGLEGARGMGRTRRRRSRAEFKACMRLRSRSLAFRRRVARSRRSVAGVMTTDEPRDLDLPQHRDDVTGSSMMTSSSPALNPAVDQVRQQQHVTGAQQSFAGQQGRIRVLSGGGAVRKIVGPFMFHRVNDAMLLPSRLCFEVISSEMT